MSNFKKLVRERMEKTGESWQTAQRHVRSKTEKRKTIKFDELKRLEFCNSDKLPLTIEHEGRRKHWVGIGWIDQGPAQGDEVLVVEIEENDE